VDSIQDEAFIVAQNKELFARVPLNGQLNEDTDAGMYCQLTLVTHVLSVNPCHLLPVLISHCS